MMWLDVDPSTVHAGMWPLVITLLLVGVVILLYLSMRKQVRRIDPSLPHERGRGTDEETLPDDEPLPDAAEPRHGDADPELRVRHAPPASSSGSADPSVR